jgi:hypothetical protein
MSAELYVFPFSLIPEGASSSTPVNFPVPFTCKVDDGVAVPIPTYPLLETSHSFDLHLY